MLQTKVVLPLFCRHYPARQQSAVQFPFGWVMILLLSLLSQALAGCDGLVGGSGDQLPDYVQDSGIGASVGAGGYFTNFPTVFSIYWLDNQTIMFVGYDGPALPMEQTSSGMISGRPEPDQYETFLWTPGQPPQRHPTLSAGGTFYAAGRIRKILPDGPNGEKQELIGPIDNPQI